MRLKFFIAYQLHRVWRFLFYAMSSKSEIMSFSSRVWNLDSKKASAWIMWNNSQSRANSRESSFSAAVPDREKEKPLETKPPRRLSDVSVSSRLPNRREGGAADNALASKPPSASRRLSLGQAVSSPAGIDSTPQGALSLHCSHTFPWHGWTCLAHATALL